MGQILYECSPSTLLISIALKSLFFKVPCLRSQYSLQKRGSQLTAPQSGQIIRSLIEPSSNVTVTFFETFETHLTLV